MKKVVFKRITIKNFLSIGDEPVQVEFNKGLNIITGSNKDKPDRQNAVGKSTIADAVYFAIFGDTLRQIKKDLIVNNITGGSTHIELEFDVITSRETVSCKVIRSLSPTRVFFYENGVDKTRDSIPNTTKYICNLINASPSIFQNCVIMTVNNAVPFMAKNKIEKRKFIEDIFGMEVFSKMLSLARQEFIDAKNEVDIYQNRLEEIENTYKVHIEQRDKIYNRRKEKRQLYKQRQQSNEEELLNLQKEIESIHTDVDTDAIRLDIDKLEDKLSKLNQMHTDILSKRADKKAEVEYKKQQYKKIGTSDDKCPVCLRPIEEHDKENIDQEKHHLQAILFDLVNEITEQTESFNRVVKSIDKVKTLIQENLRKCNEVALAQDKVKNINKRIDQLHQWQEELKRDIYNIDHSDNEFDNIVKENEMRIDDLKKQLTTANAKLSKLDVVKFVLSEEGVKSYIVNKLLELLNNKMSYYLKKLDSNSLCMFNEYFEEEIVNEKGKICSYFNFSGAERKAIDLACLFAFSDMRRMQGGVSYNIAMYDELFDSSFDSKGIDLITDVLHERVDVYDECAIVISHRKESLKTITGEVIFLEKENGITRRVDYNE